LLGAQAAAAVVSRIARWCAAVSGQREQAAEAPGDGVFGHGWVREASECFEGGVTMLQAQRCGGGEVVGNAGLIDGAS